MRTTSYPLKQSQYARIYQASERTVRNWMKKGAPLDDPREMIESFLANQRSTPVAGQKLAELATLQAGYQREVDPQAEQEAVRGELYARLMEVDGMLWTTRDFVRRYEPARWQELVAGFNALMDQVDGFFELAGLGEDYQPPAERREDLAEPRLWNWSEEDPSASRGAQG